MDMTNMCRTCLRRLKDSGYFLFGEDKLVYMVETIASIQLSDDKEMPSKICEECLKNILNFFNFRKVIIHNDVDLKERLETLKRTNYTSKPRSKVELDEFISGQAECDNIKNEISDTESITKTEDIQETDETLRRALAIKKIHRCKDCKQMFNSKLKLNNHRRTEHTAPGVCNICGTMVRADNLKKHIKLHSEVPMACDECGKTFKNSESLRSHKLIHKGLAFTCEICGKTFKLKAEHGRHLKSHIDPEARKVACSLCGKKVHELKRHMLSHTGERPYICKYCNKGFSSPYALKVHTRQHTNEKPYICEYCSLGFPQKVSLATHLKSKHGVCLNV
ncbi:zinc finger protein 85-like [Cylas formicarius]|uniref:zinc finger protein 85-like n=1 Tax=Cylas formicarius TaxID=197179 RepID=UPI0029587E60|nr:zinc finger protein 85-like [Cylas formicarius]